MDREPPADNAALPLMRQLPDTWRFNFKSIDREHQTLIDSFNASWKVFGANTSVPFREIEASLAVLKHHMHEHFKNEEAEMAAASFPGLEAHKAQHRSAADKMRAIELDAASSGVVQREHLYALLDAFIDDVLRADIPFKTFLFGRGIIV